MIDKNVGKSFSVIIRTKNEERWVGHTIQSVIDFLPGAEIVIVDNNSTDETINICKMFSKPKIFKNDDNSNYSKFIFSKIDNYTPGKALNKGIKLSSRDNILIISSHCVIKKINYSNLNKNIDKFAGIFGNQNPIFCGKKIQKRYIWSNFSNNKKLNYFSKIENRYFFHNAFAFFKKSILKKNIFDEDLVGKEDRHWAKKIVNKKMNFLYDPSHVVEHHYTINGNTWKGLG